MPVLYKILLLLLHIYFVGCESRNKQTLISRILIVLGAQSIIPNEFTFIWICQKKKTDSLLCHMVCTIISSFS